MWKRGDGGQTGKAREDERPEYTTASQVST